MKMKSAKFSQSGVEAVAMGPGEGYYPSFSLPLSTIPELKKKEVGGECYICLKVKIRSITDDSGPGNVNLEVLSGAYDEEYEKGK